jgi:amidohydrolase
MSREPEDIEELIGMRRHLHAHPELSLEEHETAAFIEAELDRLGVEHHRLAGTGVVALVEGTDDGPTLGWRADIDALPILEESDADYRSTNAGVMHACGHDVHTTVGLGLVRRMVQARDRLAGRVKFVFQPAEEASPVDEPIGAERMVVEGALDDPVVDAMFALHCMPTLDVGKIGYTGGPVWAGSDLVEIEIRGAKTHAAYPHEGIDAVVIASHIVVALQTVTSRRIDARDACVLSIGHLDAGNTYNVIADQARLTGILRTLSESAAETARREIRRIVDGVSSGMGAEASVSFTAGARLTANDPELERRTVELLRETAGADAVVPHEPQLGAEDFSSFSRRVPGCYLFLGVRNEAKGITHMIHTPRFDVDEACIPFAVESFGDVLLRMARTWEAG